MRDLQHGLNDEDQFVWLRRYHEAELLRIGMRDILGLADFEQNLAELSALADACLQYALEVVMLKNKIKSPPFVIIGLGKLGGCEINYGSDLDLMFLADSKMKGLAKLQRLAVEMLELISRRTERGIVFHTDTRLRPDGEKGLLVNALDAYEEYYRQPRTALGNPGAHPHASRGGRYGTGQAISKIGRITHGLFKSRTDVPSTKIQIPKKWQARRLRCAAIVLCHGLEKTDSSHANANRERAHTAGQRCVGH